ncbi:MAG: ABC transporter permease [Anaerolineales bacterium]|nr:ABC transporter permease [Anaerolineales bacterium]
MPHWCSFPAGYTDGTIPDSDTGEVGGAKQVEIYASPSRPISQSIIEAVVAEFMNEVDLNTAVMQVTMIQLVTSGKVPVDQASTTGEAIAQELFGNPQTNPNGQMQRLLTLESALNTGAPAAEFSPLTYLAPSMAIFFLMYTVTVGGRSLLAEREEGTLDRLLTTPTTTTQILLGKVAAIFVSGVLQVSVLIVSSALLFGLSWGSPLGVALLIVSASAAATAWGLLVTSLAKNAGQVGAYGSAVMLLFGIMGGSFMPVGDVPGLNILSKLTPNGWALDGFNTLGTGGSLADVVPALLALWLMALLVFTTAVFFYRRRWQ